MKIPAIGFVFSAMLLASCAKEAGNDTCYECKYVLNVTEDSARLTTKTLKGQLLFSWKNAEDSWNYAIVQNLNIRPAHEAVCAGNSFTGEECLKQNLGFYAEGEEFLWDGNGTLVTLEGKTITLSYPPEEVVQDIQEYCDQIDIQIFF